MSDTRVVCPNCSAVNLLPSERLGDGPACGKCKEPLFSGHPTELSGAMMAGQIIEWVQSLVRASLARDW